MCFFNQTLYRCGDYKWKTLRQHCAKEYRTGETCGMKLIMNCLEDRSGICRICDHIATKLRRRQKEAGRLRETGMRQSKLPKMSLTSWIAISTLSSEND